MRPNEREITRFTFDCPTKLHSIAKMKAVACNQSLKDYLIGLLLKDVSKHPPKFMDAQSFQKELHKILEKDAELMKKLTDR